MENHYPRGVDRAKTILLIEDDAIIAMAQAKTLEQHGYTVLTVHSGEAAIAKIANGAAVDLVLSDIDLGPDVVDGVEAAQQILAHTTVPIVFLSSHTEPEIVRKTEAVTSYGYISKSAGDVVMTASIRMAFRLFEARQELEAQRTAAVYNQERYRALFDQSFQGVYLHDLDGGILEVNDTACRQSGYSREELLQMSIFDFHPDRANTSNLPREEIKRIWRSWRPGERVTVEAEHRRKDGSDYPIESITGPVHIGDQILMLAIVQDISERHEAQRTLRENEENLRITLQSIGDAVISVDTQARITRMNPVAQQLCGWDIEEARGRPLDEVFRIINAETGEAAVNPIDRALAEGVVVGLANHTVLVSADGTAYQIADSAAPIRDADGRTQGVVLVFRDVTEEYERSRRLIENEAALRRSNQQLEGAHRLANIGVWTWEKASDTVKWSEALYEIVGRDSSSPAPAFAEQARIFTERSFIALRDAVNRALTTGEPYELELEMVRSDGSIRNVMVVGGPDYAADGTVSGLYGSVRDTTDQKQALHAKNILLRELHHRAKNHLAIVASLIGLKNDAVGDRADLSDLASQVEAIRRVYEKLQRTEALDRIEMPAYLEEIIQSAFVAGGTEVRVVTRLDNVAVDSSRAVSIGLIVNEITTNAVKHGLGSVDSPRFDAELRRDRTGWYTLSLSNNGEPIPKEVDLDNPSGLGLQLVAALTEQIRGTLAVAREPHPAFTIRFPADV